MRAWAISNEQDFYGRRSISDGPPPRGWNGRWDRSKAAFIGCLRPRLEEVLKQGGFFPEAVIRAWRDRKWLLISQSDKQDRLEYQVRMGDLRPWFVAIRAEAFGQAGVASRVCVQFA